MRSQVEGFIHRRAGHCGSGALRDVLEHRGLNYGRGPLSEGAVFGLGGGLGAFFAELGSLSPPVYLVGRTGGMESDIAAILGAGLEIRDTDDAAEGWAWVREEIDAGRIPMVWADIARLDYLRVRMTNTRHDILVVGYDTDEGVAWVADNDRDSLQACSLASLAAARNSDGFPGPNRHTTFLYTWPDALPDAEVAVSRGLQRAVLNMRGDPDAVGRQPGAVGLSAIDAFAESYRGWPATFGERLGEALGGLSVLIVKAGTGGAMFRSLHQEFLADSAALLDSDGLRAAADVYGELSEAWVALAAAARAGDHAAGLPLVERHRGAGARGRRRHGRGGWRTFLGDMGTTHIAVTDAGPTVADVMLAAPDTVPSSTTVGEARAVFESPRQKLLVVAEGGRYVGALGRDGLGGADDGAPVTDLDLGAVPTLGPDAPTARIFEIVEAHDLTRIPVVDESGALLGLVCFNRSHDAFCVA